MSDVGFSYQVSDEILERFATSTLAQRIQWLDEMREFSWLMASPETRRRWRQAREAHRCYLRSDSALVFAIGACPVCRDPLLVLQALPTTSLFFHCAMCGLAFDQLPITSELNSRTLDELAPDGIQLPTGADVAGLDGMHTIKLESWMDEVASRLVVARP